MIYPNIFKKLVMGFNQKVVPTGLYKTWVISSTKRSSLWDLNSFRMEI